MGTSPGNPVVKTPHFQCRGAGSTPGLGTKIHMPCDMTKKINKFLKRIRKNNKSLLLKNENIEWYNYFRKHFGSFLHSMTQGSLACCSPWGRRELDTTEQLNWTELNWWPKHMSLPLGSDSKEFSCNVGDLAWIPGWGRFPWRRKWQPTPVFLPGKSPWTEEPGGLHSMGSQGVGHDWTTNHMIQSFHFWYLPMRN